MVARKQVEGPGVNQKNKDPAIHYTSRGLVVNGETGDQKSQSSSWVLTAFPMT